MVDGGVIVKRRFRIPAHRRLAAIGAAAKLGHGAAISILEEMAFGNGHVPGARCAARYLSDAPYHPNLEIVLDAITARKNIQERGLLQLVQKLPTMEFAVAIAALQRANGNVTTPALLAQLQRKRNRGAFETPSLDAREGLRAALQDLPNLRGDIERILGVDLSS